MRMAALLWGLLVIAGGLQAAPPVAPVMIRLQGVDVAAREVRADDMVWALSSTATIRAPGVKRGSLKDLQPGMHVRVTLVPTEGEVPIISSITVVPD